MTDEDTIEFEESAHYELMREPFDPAKWEATESETHYHRTWTHKETGETISHETYQERIGERQTLVKYLRPTAASGGKRQ